ncbi:SDR family oxidoreductase [Paroceanicella profunda]|uniref:SDR family oxidoreductase n=1 Tax=Paroceanicella profunda TaxID=2579971 RepID=A0A5B8FGP5_9RHOB|nr:SDR family oxidoreductase [Paroceanicella profunda]QDL91237.1 SDR family oxidoreductase [Paroceanicella profunda]
MGLLTGKTAIITGAVTGVGLAVSRKFAAAGARLVLTDTNDAKLAEEARDLRESGAEIVTFSCELKEKLSVNNLIALALGNYDEIDILVNASRVMRYGDALENADEDLDVMMDTNLKGALRLSQAVARRMISQAEGRTDTPAGGNGAIVNISSIAGQRTLPDLLAYSVTCAAIDQMTRNLAVALAPSGIRVNGVALGGVMTANLRDSLKSQEELRAKMIAVTPLGRVGEATEAADAVAWLASSAASFVTGQILAVDGGRTVLDPLSVPAH